MAVNDLMENQEERPAYVRFEIKAIKDPKATMQAGHYVAQDIDYVMVSALGSRDTFHKRADKWFVEVEKSVTRGRVPVKHLEYYRDIYARWKKGQEPPVNGTSVKDWNAISPAQCANMIECGIRTIEDMAQATDEGMRYIGAGSQDLKAKARAWLKAGGEAGPLIEEVSALKKENAQLQGSIKSLQDQINRLGVQEEGRKEYVPMEHSAQVIAPKSDVEVKKEVTDLLKSEYEKKFGRLPGNMKDETIRQRLQE